MAHLSLKTRLIVNFSIVILIGAILYVVIGIQLIGNTIVRQAQDKVRLDLNSAREVYLSEMKNLKNIIRLSAIRFFIKDAFILNDRRRLTVELQKIRERESLDILNLTDPIGNVMIRTRNPAIHSDRLRSLAVNRVIEKRTDTVTTRIISHEELEQEGKDLAEQARIKSVPTPKAYPRKTAEETAGMLIEAASPIFDDKNTLLGVIYGGKLLNRNYEIVDKVKDIVYKGEKYKGKEIGTATIFQGDLRISTNVRKADGSRAIGTRVSREVYEQVIVKGKPWIDRAFVVNDWYITAYEPIKNLTGRIIGILYVGILEWPYLDLRNRVVLNFLAVAFLSVILMICIAYLTATRTVNPLKNLLSATKKIARGNLSHRVNIKSGDEIGYLADSFNHMMEELEQATLNYQELNRTLEQKIREKTRALKKTQAQLIQTEKLTSLGKMAAGIAHEINNPLTSILLNAHLLEEKLKQNKHLKENLELIIGETGRCSTIVKDLLHFSRQTQPKKHLTDINEIVEQALTLLNNQIRLQKVKVSKKLSGDLPKTKLDKNKIEQVFTNIILNALEAMPEGGILVIESQISEDNRCLEISFRDSGCGIPDSIKGKIFDPFFTTKGATGTGLGLSVSFGIVEQHQGRIEVESEKNKGTTILVSLPISRMEKSCTDQKSRGI